MERLMRLAIDASTTVRELLRRHPEVFDVLLGHGMCEDCKADPPPVPLGHFANKHCAGDVAGLIAELQGAMSGAGTD
jgi:hypothetical protein